MEGIQLQESTNSAEFLPRIVVKTLFRNARLFALVALIALGLLFTPRGASAAGCAVPYAAGAPILSPLANPQLANAPNQPFTIVGLWNVNYTATYDDNFPLPPGPPARRRHFLFWSPTRPGTRTAPSLKTPSCRRRVETCALACGRNSLTAP